MDAYYHIIYIEANSADNAVRKIHVHIVKSDNNCV